MVSPWSRKSGSFSISPPSRRTSTSGRCSLTCFRKMSQRIRASRVSGSPLKKAICRSQYWGSTSRAAARPSGATSDLSQRATCITAGGLVDTGLTGRSEVASWSSRFTVAIPTPTGRSTASPSAAPAHARAASGDFPSTVAW
ncbi:MAG: hypothetical protein ACXWK6_04525 [Myxococcaceae bacterium]